MFNCRVYSMSVSYYYTFTDAPLNHFNNCANSMKPTHIFLPYFYGKINSEFQTGTPRSHLIKQWNLHWHMLGAKGETLHYQSFNDFTTLYIHKIILLHTFACFHCSMFCVSISSWLSVTNCWNPYNGNIKHIFKRFSLSYNKE